MAGEPSMLELLRSRLTDLEARQRATGGAAEGGFWERFAGSMPSPPSESDARSARAGRRARRLAPAARPERRASGPWSGLAAADADSLEQLDLRHPTWLDAAGYEQMVDDPVWVEPTPARAEAWADINEPTVPAPTPG